MKRIIVFLVLALVVPRVGGAAEGEPDLDDLRRRVLTAEDRRFRRALELARMYSKLGRLADARRLYEGALQMRGSDVDVTDALLQLVRKLGDHGAQLPLYRRLSSSRPGDVQLQMRMGECLWRLKRTGEAREVWAAMLKRFPAERTAYDDLISFYMAEGRPEDARHFIRRRRERFGEDARLLLSQAELAVTARKPEAALPLLLKCLELDLAEKDSRRAEELLFLLARETGRTEEVRRKLASGLETVDAQLAGRLLDLAGGAADRPDFREAATLAQRALRHITDPAKRAEITSRIAIWRARAPK